MKKFQVMYPNSADAIPSSLPEDTGKALLYAGGTDALERLREEIEQPELLVNLKNVPGLRGIVEKDN